MADMTSAELNHGLAKSKDYTGWFSTPKFREMCRITPEDLGLPDTLTAMREACCARSPKEYAKYSHPAVYLAGCAVGWFEMQNRTERELLPLFEVAYAQLVRRVMAGDDLTMPVCKALPEKVHIPSTPDFARSRINALKEMV